ncbi:hypothetical protein [Mucilaginibacter jinjuensis]|uniref:Uncharacterized protein n=1 Tax=Mucilaginibacter jinjuensis TaxID=1176721 RepID=A0ABY7TDS0_9SPHI|nr:hypothetical protein [Mucilaginibacter jinjuensis]WCT14389.1 hypothetical protein PQO05_10635 [Mucilaginibacter jinjuensis]
MSVKQQFKISYKDLPVEVAEHNLRNGRVFSAEFSDASIKPLIITIAHDSNDKKFWTSMPEGRQELAEEIGRLIADYIRNHKEPYVIITDKKLPVLSLFD